MLRRVFTLAVVLAASAAMAQPQLRQAGELDAQIDALAERSALLAAQQSRSGDEVAAARDRLAQLNVREQQALARMGANQAKLSRLLGALEMYSKHPPPALLVHPDDAKKAVRAAILMRAVTPDLERQATALSSEVAAARAVRREAASASEGLFLSESEFTERAAEIEALIEEKRALRVSLAADAERDVPALAARIQNLPRQGATSANKAVAPGSLAPPVAGRPRLRFGQSSPRSGPLQGWLWSPPARATVRAPADGIVEFAGPLEGWDNVVILAVGERTHMVLAGIDPPRVTQGVRVQAGDVVALMPPRRAGESPELYVEIRLGGEPIDPARFFAAIPP